MVAAYSIATSRSSYSSINLLTKTNCSYQDVFACLYSLSTSELNLLDILLKSEVSLTLENLAKKMNRDKGTVFRSLQKLVSLNLCIKEARTLEAGGYYHIYNASDLDSIERDIEKRIKEIGKSLNNIRKRIRRDIEKMATISN